MILKQWFSSAMSVALFGGSLLAVNVTPANALAFDQNVTPDVIFGSGNANGGFTVDQSSGIELGLRAKLRHNASGAPENTFNSNGDGTYSFDAGAAPTQSPSTAVWSFEWSINSNFDDTGENLSAFTYELGMTSNVDAVMTAFDPINDPSWADHAFGTNSTSNGGGQVAGLFTVPMLGWVGYSDMVSSRNVAQNSRKPHWEADFFDPTLDATYTYTLSAFAPNSGDLLASTSIDVVVGTGGVAPIPEPVTGLLTLIGLGGLGVAGLRRRQV